MSEEINPEIMKELRKSRSILKSLFLVTVVSVIGYGIMDPLWQREQSGESWSVVRAAMEQQQFAKALAIAKVLVAGQPGYDYGHTYLGYIYLAMDDLTNAETQYVRAYELFPCKQNKENMEAVQKRIATGGDFKALTK